MIPAIIRGHVISGVGQATSLVEIPWVTQQVREKLGFVPYPGTLNLRAGSESDRRALRALKDGPGLPLEPEPGFCAARCYPVVIAGRIAAAIVVPEIAGYADDLIELLAPVRLRDALGLADGAPVSIEPARPATS